MSIGRNHGLTLSDVRQMTDQVGQIDHLDYRDLHLLGSEVLCRICTAVQIQPRKHVLDHADHTAPTRQHELDHTDHTDHTDQDYICSVWQM